MQKKILKNIYVNIVFISIFCENFKTLGIFLRNYNEKYNIQFEQNSVFTVLPYYFSYFFFKRLWKKLKIENYFFKIPNR